MATFESERRIELRQLRNRLAEIQGTIFRDRQPMQKLEACITGAGKGPEGIPTSGWGPFEVMGRWGHLDQTTWFRMQVKTPKSFQGKRMVALINPCAYTDIPGVPEYEESGEGLAYVNGKAWQGIDRNHDFMLLSKKAKAGEEFDIALECTPQTRFDATHVLQYADIAVMDLEAWNFYWDVQVALEVFATLGDAHATRRKLFAAIQAAVFQVDLQRLGEKAYQASLKKAARALRASLEEFPAEEGAGKLCLVGHSHIDTAWLWPLRETRRKVGRTWATVLKLMEEYPEFIFQASQPELYCFAKENHPEIWAGLKKRVKEGRWEPCGASWVEQDSNVASGEALVRQFLYGNRFYEKEFGMRSKTAWLPDAFGFPWSLPQILKKAQIEHFFTIKISWSEFTKFPYGYFQWQGVDGTRINAMMPPLNYNGDPTPKDCITQREAFQEKALVDETIFPIGFGDGGGGPTPKMIEYGKRLENITGVPQCSFGRTEDCFDRMHAQVEGGAALPVFNDELYLELHRGCQTTQARTKRNNRKAECGLHTAELLGSLSLLHGGEYAQEDLAKAWRLVLTNQFHDILPGSSITEVYAVAEEDYARARAHIDAAQTMAGDFLSARIHTQGPGKAILVFNPLSWVRSDVAQVKIALPRNGRFHVIAPDGAVVPSQKIGREEIIFEARHVPPLGYAVFHLVSGAAQAADTAPLKASTRVLENQYLRLRMDSHGRFTSLYDKVEERETLAAKGNVLQFFDDRPGANDAWDIDHNFESIQWEAGKASAIELLESGPVRAVVRVRHALERSTIVQDITLYAQSTRVDVRSQVEWREKRTLLKVAFPVEILSSRATYHIQFATIERNTHDNWEYDRARFEVTAHHWADLSEGDYGVSLLNDCKYGYDIKEQTMRLSLLRSPVDPDPTADEGAHSFTYSLYPHAGDWRNGTVQHGFELNQPLMAQPVETHEGVLPAAYAFAVVDVDHVLIDTVKKAEDSEALIVRLYESYGQRGPVNLVFERTPLEVLECDLMEEHDAPMPCSGNTLSFEIKPYEIRSFKVFF